MNSLPSSSDPQVPLGHRQESSAFFLLDEKIQRWIWEQGWDQLHDFQEHAIRVILEKDCDVLISAGTARGKTEAAFLPICSTLIEDSGGSVRALCLSPTKALINDQWERLDSLCENLDLPAHRWHGDVQASCKKQVRQEPTGILIITPESLEALFDLHGSKVPLMFSDLEFIVVDELHAFIGNERGRQLQSLLHRLETALGHRVRRIALSATIGDMALAAAFLRPEDPSGTEIIVASDDDQEIKLQVRGYINREPHPQPAGCDGEEANDEDNDHGGDQIAIAEHIFKVLRGKDNLIFCNTRQEVEAYADLLHRMCDRERVPNEFVPHHGSLVKEIREDVEARLKDKSLPLSVVCTTTLELGIDIGSVASIAQVGIPFTVSSVRQRLGRSGRRGNPAVMRIYIQEEELGPLSPIQDLLRPHLVQAVAMVRLLLAKWYEPPRLGALHLSTLVQQVLSMIAQCGGARAQEVWRILCSTGPFAEVSAPMFAQLLRTLAAHELITQMSDGTLLLDLAGERLVNHYSFYAAFTTPEEYRMMAGGKILGSLPVTFPVARGSFIIFAGRRWEVVSVNDAEKVIELAPAAGGRAPSFAGGGGMVDDRIREEMFKVYTSTDVPAFLDSTARFLLDEGRKHFLELRLGERSVIGHGRHTLVFPWRGDRIVNTILLQLRAAGLEVSRDGLALTIHQKAPEDILDHFKMLIKRGPADPITLAATVENKVVEKHDQYLDEDLLNADCASRHLDARGAWEAICNLAAGRPTTGDGISSPRP